MKHTMYVGDVIWLKLQTVRDLIHLDAMRKRLKSQGHVQTGIGDFLHTDSHYLASIENEVTIPSLPVVIQLIRICGLPVERYFNPKTMREESTQRQRVSHKIKLCPEEYLPIIEGAIDGAMRLKQMEDT